MLHMNQKKRKRKKKRMKKKEFLLGVLTFASTAWYSHFPLWFHHIELALGHNMSSLPKAANVFKHYSPIGSQPLWLSPGQGSLWCYSGQPGIKTLGQLQWGKQALSHTDSSWQAMQVIKAELCRDCLGRRRVGGGGTQKGGGTRRGRDRVDHRTASWWQWVSIRPLLHPHNLHPPLVCPKGFTQWAVRKNAAVIQDAVLRTASLHLSKSPAPILPSWIMLRGVLSAMKMLCKTMIPSSDVNSLEDEMRVVVEWASWCI